MRPMQIAVGLALTFTLAAAVHAKDKPALVKFEGAIGVDTLTAAGGVDVLNVVRGINPGGRAWVLRKFEARVGTDGQVSAQGKGLLFASGDLIATRGAVTQVVVTLFCGAANATATAFTSPPRRAGPGRQFQGQGRAQQRRRQRRGDAGHLRQPGDAGAVVRRRHRHGRQLVRRRRAGRVERRLIRPASRPTCDERRPAPRASPSARCRA